MDLLTEWLRRSCFRAQPMWLDKNRSTNCLVDKKNRRVHQLPRAKREARKGNWSTDCLERSESLRRWDRSTNCLERSKRLRRRERSTNYLERSDRLRKRPVQHLSSGNARLGWLQQFPRDRISTINFARGNWWTGLFFLASRFARVNRLTSFPS